MTTSEFATPLDICNRALQIAGAARITAFTDDSREAAECNAVYDKLRQAELRTNVWRFAAKKTALRPIASTSMLFTPYAHSATTYYILGAIVSYDGIYWQNTINLNYNTTPGSAGGAWVPYFGSLVVSVYDSTETTGYFLNELVYELDGPTATDYYRVYTATTDQIADDPTTPPAYDATVTYGDGDIVTYSGSTYISLVNNNLANTPASTYALWNKATSYTTADNAVDPATGRIYTAQTSANVGNNPATDTTNWARKSSSPYFSPWVAWASPKPAAFTGWTQQNPGFTLEPINLHYPAASGPLAQVGQANLYMLPNGWLRSAPQDTEKGQVPILGGPLNNWPDDFEYTGNYFTSRESRPIVYRFVADVTDVTAFDPLFCEALAAQIAVATIPILTQSDTKLNQAMGLYRAKVAQARVNNGIDMGETLPPQDDYVSVRA